MNKQTKFLTVLSVILLICAILLIRSTKEKSGEIEKLRSSINDLEKTIKNQKNSITDLEEQVESFADIAEEKQGQLDRVENFDNSVNANYSLFYPHFFRPQLVVS